MEKNRKQYKPLKYCAERNPREDFENVYKMHSFLQTPLYWLSWRMKKIMKQRHKEGLETNCDPKTGKVKGKKGDDTFGKP